MPRRRLNRATAAEDRARSLRYVGWTLALLGEPVEGEGALRESLAVEPGHPDSLWFLARVLYEGQARPADALPVLDELLESEQLPDDQRTLVEHKRDEVAATLAGAANPTLPTVPA